MAKRSDANQQEITDALRQLGYSVFDTHTLGKGFGDIAVGKFGTNWLIEVKNGKGKLTEPEKEFHENWRGQIDIARTIDDALRIVGAVE